MQAAKAKADEFAAGAVSEQAFNDLCKRYADDGDTKYDDTNGSLFSKVVSSNMDTGTSDWLLSDDRKAGDVTVIENSSSGCYYVLYLLISHMMVHQMKQLRQMYLTTNIQNIFLI